MSIALEQRVKVLEERCEKLERSLAALRQGLDNAVMGRVEPSKAVNGRRA